MSAMEKWCGIPGINPVNISKYLPKLIFLKRIVEKQTNNLVYDNFDQSDDYALERILGFTKI